MSGFRVARVYDAPAAEDGQRVLVDRLWPRGLSKDKAELDDWAKEVAPSTELRKWFHAATGHERDDEFAERYAAELDGAEQQTGLAKLRAAAEKGTVTLLTAVKDPAESYLSVLLERLAAKK
ncbi:DUF488 domain-containing protein [Yinghuangia soli]|uniref:DUF488 family protein n=1 Tax=Yinghuangia soli TaxID=2908204 RepID=A0AA41PY57_9ACTN|nr:DUF488 family protein [Yinghuangia soli]MCF2527913.1 DUF488 family protein [Yinghuangia soli]